MELGCITYGVKWEETPGSTMQSVFSRRIRDVRQNLKKESKNNMAAESQLTGSCVVT